MQKHFPDWQRRLEIIERHQLNEVRTKQGAMFVSIAGSSIEEAVELLQGSTVQGSMPEPLRLAHLIATAIVNGESKGNS